MILPYRPRGLPAYLTIKHKLRVPCVDLEFQGHGKPEERYRQFKNAIEPILEIGMAVEPATKSAAVRLQVPDLGLDDDEALQREKMKACLETTKRLVQWYAKNKPYIEQVTQGRG